MTILTPTLLSELKTHYAHPSRHYHTASHIHSLLSLLDAHRERFADPEAVEVAIWYHDVVYDSESKVSGGNEMLSARFCVERLIGLYKDSSDSGASLRDPSGVFGTGSGVGDGIGDDDGGAGEDECDVGSGNGPWAERIERIKVMIEATAGHRLPSGEQLGVPAETADDGSREGFVRDAAMFLDMDLSILGADEAEFDRYEEGVRREYAWVGEEEWRAGRAAVLRGFQDREHIYFSDLFRGLLEEKARANLRRSLARLESGEGRS